MILKGADSFLNPVNNTEFTTVKEWHAVVRVGCLIN